MRYLIILTLVFSCAKLKTYSISSYNSKADKVSGRLSYVCGTNKKETSKEFKTYDDCEKERFRLDEKEDSRLEKKRLKNIDIFISKYPKYKKFKKDVINNVVQIGLPTQLLELTTASKCKKNKTFYSKTNLTQYVCGRRYIYTRNGFVTTIQK